MTETLLPASNSERKSVRVEAEAVLRDIAYVLHLAQRVRREILEEREEQELTHA